MLRPLLALLLLGSAALAEGEAPPDGVPTRAVPCAMLDATLHADGGDPVVCSKDGCFKPDMWRNTAIRHPRPAAQPDWLGPVARVGDDQVCLGTTCRKLGRKLAAAVAEARKGEQPILSATTDLKAVVVGETAWNLQADQPLTFVAPPFYRNQRTDRPVVRGIFPAGDLLVVWWSACAGPCTRFAIADSAGRAKGPEGEGGGGVFQLDPKTFAVYGEYASIYLYEMGTARPRGSLLELTQDPLTVSMIRGQEGTVLPMYGRGDGVEVARIETGSDAPIRPWVTQYLPRCAEP